MPDIGIIEWPFLGLIILLQLLHVIINIATRCRRRIKLRRSQENPQRCTVRVIATPRTSAEHQQNIIIRDPAPGTSRDPQFVPDAEYAVVDATKKKTSKIGIEPVTDVKFNVHQEDQVYCNMSNTGNTGEYQNTKTLAEESDYQSTWGATSSKKTPVSPIKIIKKSLVSHIHKSADKK